MLYDHAAGQIWETNDERALFLLQKKLLVWLAVQRNFGGFGAAKASVASSAISTSARHPFLFREKKQEMGHRLKSHMDELFRKSGSQEKASSVKKFDKWPGWAGVFGFILGTRVGNTESCKTLA